MTDSIVHINIQTVGITEGAAIKAQFLSRQLSDRPHVMELLIRERFAPIDLLPEGSKIVASEQNDRGVDVLAEGDDYLVHMGAGWLATVVLVAARELDRADEIIAEIASRTSPGDRTDEVPVSIWRKAHVPHAKDRPLLTSRWEAIRENYSASVQPALDALMRRRALDEDEGRLILFTGEPGTGKTHAIRALMNEWQEWCDVQLISDPDRMFLESGYLLEVLESGSGTTAPSVRRSAGEVRWKLIIAEDADEYLRSSARHDAGAALGRLLNTTDGLLGQGTRAIVLLTTNEELHRLHPAITRPGRCLSRIEIPRMTNREAQEWMGVDSSFPEGATLAELFEMKRSGSFETKGGIKTGAYL
jgi:hypothetical protein